MSKGLSPFSGRFTCLVLVLCSGGASGLLAPAVARAAPSGKEIMQRNEEVRRLQDVNSKAVLKTGGGGPERTKNFTWWRKLQKDQIHFNTLTRFHEPAEIRGQGILFVENSGGENDVQMYLPTFKKVRRVESQAQSGSFMGSEFSYSDIASTHVEDYAYKVLTEEACPGSGAPGVKCHKIEAIPATEAVKERTGYSRTLNWIRQDNSMHAYGEYYDAEGKLWKKLEASKTTQVDAKAGKWMALSVRMNNVKNGKFTLLEFSDVKANAGVDDATFTVQNLQRVK
jgi:outer membrane lipoprotein-sorting protein